MATYTIIDGFEAGVVSTQGGGLAATVTNASVTTGAKRSGSYGLYCNSTGAAARIQKAYASTNMLVVRFYLQFPSSLPSATCVIFSAETAGTYHELYLDPADGKCYAGIGSTGTKHTTALTTGTWYCFDVKCDMSANPNKMDFSIDGVAATQLSVAVPATTSTTLNLGTTTSVNFQAYYDDLGGSATAADYPLTHTQVVGLSPSADGTHNAGTDTIEDNAGADIGAVTAYNLVNKIPMNSSTTVYIRQVAIEATKYFECALANIPAGAIVLGVRGFVAYTASGTAANSAATYVREGSTDRAIYAGDMSPGTSTVEYKSAIIALSSYTEATINALVVRGGYASDVTPNPRWISILLQCAIIPASNISLSAGTVTATGRAITITNSGGVVTVTLSRGTITASGPKMSVTPGAVSKSLAVGSLTITGQKLTVTPGAVSKALAKGALTATGQTLTVAPGPVSKSLAKGAITASGPQLTVLPGAVTIDFDTGQLTLTGQALSITPGAVSIGLDTATITASGPIITVTAGGIPPTSINLQTGILSAEGRAIAILPGEVLIALASGLTTLTGQTISVTPGAVQVALDTGELTLTGRVITVTTPGAAISINLDTGQLSLNGQNITILPGPVALSLASGLLTASGGQITITPGPVSVTLDTAQMSAYGRIITIDAVLAIVKEWILKTRSTELTLDARSFALGLLHRDLNFVLDDRTPEWDLKTRSIEWELEDDER